MARNKPRKKPTTPKADKKTTEKINKVGQWHGDGAIKTRTREENGKTVIDVAF